jgi:hypothetical protein
MAAQQKTGLDDSATPEASSSAPPDDFKVAGGDLAGYWESAAQETRKADAKEGSPPVTFTPLFVSLSDSKLEKTKSSTLVHGRLEAPCLLRCAEKEDGYKVFPKGTLFGIWTKPGMKPLGALGGTVVWMANSGFKDVGKESDMALYDIRYKGEGQKLQIHEDRRDHSLPSSIREKRAQLTAAAGDDIPF